jgi:hypothetical protein
MGKRSGDLRNRVTVQIRERFEEHDSIAKRLVCEREPAMTERCCERTKAIVVVIDEDDTRCLQYTPLCRTAPPFFPLLFFPLLPLHPLPRPLENFLAYFLIKLEEVSEVQMLPNVETILPRKLEAADFFFPSFVHRLPGMHG